jgi:mitotic spindle assembly checkpoint protein MAD2
MSATTTANVITLRGSTDIVTEFFNYSVNNILYQRGIYPPESFKKVSAYGLSVMMTEDEGLLVYLNNILRQLDSWLMNGSVQKLILVVKSIENGETLERWVFDCAATNAKGSENNNGNKEITAVKSQKEIHNEIQAIMRQITSSVTYLPLLSEPCCFDLLVYADQAATVPVTWEDSDPCFIANSSEVNLRSFTTKIHKVDLAVSFRVDEDGL